MNSTQPCSGVRRFEGSSGQYNALSKNANGLDFAAITRPSTDASHEFAEFCFVSPDELALAIGMGDMVDSRYASFLMCCRKYLRMRLALDKRAPALVAQEMNEMVYECCSSTSLIACFFGVYNAKTKQLRYVNAGYESPLLVRGRADRTARLEQSGPMLGLRQLPHYTDGCVQLRSGDRLVAFTPSVIDSFSPENTGSAEQNLISTVRTSSGCCAFDLAETILLKAESRSSPSSADRSVMAVCIEEATPATLFKRSREAALV